MSRSPPACRLTDLLSAPVDFLHRRGAPHGPRILRLAESEPESSAHYLCLPPAVGETPFTMGISWANGVLALVHDVVRSERLVVAGLRMAELGNQKLRPDVLGHSLAAKKFFTAINTQLRPLTISLLTL